MFARPDGSRYRWYHLRKPFERARQAVGLTVPMGEKVTPFRWHAFRHAGATELERAGVSRDRIRIIMCLESVAMTSRYIADDAVGAGEALIKMPSVLRRVA